MKKLILGTLLILGFAYSSLVGVDYAYPTPTPTPAKHETDSTIVGSQVAYGYTPGSVLTALTLSADGSMLIGGTYLREISFVGPSFAQVAGKPDKSASNLYYLFDPDTEETCATVRFSLPSYYDSGSMATYRIRWYAEVADTDDVVWAVGWRTFTSGGVAWTDWQTDVASAVSNTGNDIPNTSAWIEWTDGFSANDIVEFNISRPDTPADDLNADAKFGEIMIRTYLNFTQ